MSFICNSIIKEQIIILKYIVSQKTSSITGVNMPELLTVFIVFLAYRSVLYRVRLGRCYWSISLYAKPALARRQALQWPVQWGMRWLAKWPYPWRVCFQIWGICRNASGPCQCRYARDKHVVGT